MEYILPINVYLIDLWKRGKCQCQIVGNQWKKQQTVFCFHDCWSNFRKV